MRWPGLAALLLAGCASPLGGRDVDVFVGPSTVPGAGAVLGLAQRVTTARGVRWDVELDLARQVLRDEGPDGDDEWSQARIGAAASFPADRRDRWVARVGYVWARALGDARLLDTTGDFGGGYVGLGYRFPLGPSLSFEPDLSLLVLDAEGGGDFGYVPVLGWRLVWHL